MNLEQRTKFDREFTNLTTVTSPDAPPPWWHDDVDAANSGLAAARALGFRPDVLKAGVT